MKPYIPCINFFKRYRTVSSLSLSLKLDPGQKGERGKDEKRESEEDGLEG